MNKDVSVLSFSVARDKGILGVSVISVFNEMLIPLSIRAGLSVQDWLKSRLVISHRRDISAFFRTIRIYSLESMLCCTNAISLLDSFWVKEKGSDLLWARVSPYRNPLNENVAHFSFDGKINGKHITSSPDFATSGNFPKCWKKVNHEIYLYKAGSSGAFNAGNEPYSEYFASELAQKLGIDSVSYELLTYKGKIVTRCKNICTEDMGMYSVAEVFPYIDRYLDILKVDIGVTKSSACKKIVDMLLIDFLTLNIDRHFNNMGILVENSSQKLIGLAPIFDYNLSFMPYFVKGSVSLEGTISDVSNDVYRYCKDDTPFEDIIPLLLSISPRGYVKEKITSLTGFSFSSDIERSDIANDILERQIGIAKKYI